MYNLAKNNYHQKPKNSNIYTPKEVSEFIFELLKDKTGRTYPASAILDPCCGTGNLLEPWENAKKYRTFGNDIDPAVLPGRISRLDFLQLKTSQGLGIRQPNLILCNPPFNGAYPKLAPEIWLDKIIELFGKEVPIVLFAPVGFCANLTLKSKRLEKFNNGTYPPIVSRITLPKNIFKGVIFHSEILIFNIQGLEPHYFYQPHHESRTINF